jgi:hypothetical protein
MIVIIMSYFNAFIYMLFCLCQVYFLFLKCAERLLAAQNPLSHADRPHQLFADAPPMGPGGVPLAVPMMPPPPPPGQPVGPPPLGGMMPPPPMNIPPPASQYNLMSFILDLACLLLSIQLPDLMQSAPKHFTLLQIFVVSQQLNEGFCTNVYLRFIVTLAKQFIMAFFSF